MRSMLLLATAGLCLVAAQSGAALAKDDESTCHGTALQFVATPSEAARQALKEQKLVFVLHVSGHFEDPSLT